MKKLLVILIALCSFNLFSAEEQSNIKFQDNEHTIVLTKLFAKERFDLMADDINLGYLTFREQENNVFYIIELHINKDYRFKGLGKKLLNFVNSYLFKLGAIKIYLIPAPENNEKNCHEIYERDYKALRNFYKKLGFSDGSICMEIKPKKSTI